MALSVIDENGNPVAWDFLCWLTKCLPANTKQIISKYLKSIFLYT